MRGREWATRTSWVATSAQSSLALVGYGALGCSARMSVDSSAVHALLRRELAGAHVLREGVEAGAFACHLEPVTAVPLAAGAWRVVLDVAAIRAVAAIACCPGACASG
jgi:hypothetical protein